MAAAAPASVVPANRRRIPNPQEDMEFETTEGIEPISSFENMGIREDLLRGVYAYGFEKPSAIQQRAVRPIIEGRDVIAQAQSGTGKTSMIALTVCQVVDTSMREYVLLESPCCFRLRISFSLLYFYMRIIGVLLIIIIQFFGFFFHVFWGKRYIY